MPKRIALLLFVLWLPATAAAGPYEFFGVGPRAIAMGGAYAALGEDVAGIYYNMAAITQVERFQIELGYVYAKPNWSLNGKVHDMDANRGVAFGAIVSTVLVGHRLSIGVNSFIPDDHVLRFLVLPTDHPHSPFTANANHTAVSVFGGGLEIFSWWSVGAGANAQADNRGGIDVRINEDSPSYSALESKIGSCFSPVAGLWFRPLEWLRAGASYREKMEITLELPNTIDVPPLKVFDDNSLAILRESHLVLLANTWSHFSPRQFELGVAARPHERLLVSGDVTYMVWSEMPTDAPASSVYLSGGLNDIFPTVNGPPPPDPDFRNTLNPALGLEGRVLRGNHLDLDLRGGYRFRPTPVPDQTGFSNYLDSDTHLFSSGVGLTFGGLTELLPRPFSFDAFVQYQLMEKRRIRKIDPANETGDYTLEGNWLNVGANMTLRF